MFNIFKSKNLSEEKTKELNLDAREKQLAKEIAAFSVEKDTWNLRKEYRALKSELKEKINYETMEAHVNSAKETKEFEHDFHSKRGEQDTELAVIDKAIEVKKILMEDFNKIEDIKATAMKDKYEAIIKEKDASITRLDGIVKVLTTKLPDVDLKNMNITVNPNKE